MIPQGNDSPGGRSPRGMTPRGPVVKDAALGTQRSWVRIPPPPPALGPKSDRGGHECCGADFGSRIKISGHPLGQSASFFEIYLLVLGGLTPQSRGQAPAHPLPPVPRTVSGHPPPSRQRPRQNPIPLPSSAEGLQASPPSLQRPPQNRIPLPSPAEELWAPPPSRTPASISETDLSFSGCVSLENYSPC